ncbi:MAG: AAA family ATPase [Thiolinea sp.]
MDKTRHLADKIEQLLPLFPAIAVIGPRQCGKSTLLQQLRPQWRYYDLESPDDYQLVSHDPVSFFTLNPQALLLDEVQQYPELFRVLRGVIDQERKSKGRFLLTGSSSPDITRGIHESLAGRIATVELAPFKQSELYGHPLPALYALLTDAQTRPQDFLALPAGISLEQSMHAWLHGGYPDPCWKVHKPLLSTSYGWTTI